MLITYIGHSGVMARTRSTTLVFDYSIGEEPVEALRNTPYSLVFVSHNHSDHLNRAIFDWQKLAPQVRYVLSGDIPISRHKGYVVLNPGEQWQADGVRVRAYGSTDAGCSFLVETDGMHVFHAGDLNLWHWPQDSTQEEIVQAYTDFDEALTPLLGETIDIAFFPVDPRMGGDYDTGARLFIERIHPRVFIPIHFGEDFSVAQRFAQRSFPVSTRILAPTCLGDRFAIPDTHR